MSPELPGAAVSQTFLAFHISRRRTGQALLRASCRWEVSAAFLTGRTRLGAWGRSRATAIASHPGCSASPQLTPVGAGRSHLAQEVLPPGQSFDPASPEGVALCSPHSRMAVRLHRLGRRAPASSGIFLHKKSVSSFLHHIPLYYSFNFL